MPKASSSKQHGHGEVRQEKSRLNARECRVRKKQKYSHLESIVNAKEQEVLKAREELQKLIRAVEDATKEF